jgi:aminopeptidase N
VHGQEHLPRYDELDVQHYDISIDLYDDHDTLFGHAIIEIKFKKDVDSFYLDLKSKTEKSGMMVTRISENSAPAIYSHENDRLVFTTSQGKAGTTNTYDIYYKGVPGLGLIIDKNRHGNRTFFGDNWPNRAHYWIPSVDHPSDKATFSFGVTAPVKYEVVGTGVKLEESIVDEERKFTKWATEIPLPTKCAVIGVAEFAVRYEEINEIPVASWVFYQEKETGFEKYDLTEPILKFFTENLSAYPYEKLYHVQSITRWGGMENAGNIFYTEVSTFPDRDNEGLFAHEIAHQWFGNSASELSWSHVWLSEGFATYFTHLYFENRYGEGMLQHRLRIDREKIIDYYNRIPGAVIQSTEGNYDRILNTNSYQKGSWVLHMLRQELGDEAFWESMRAYYKAYRLSNATTEDLREVIESETGKDFDLFFDQWLYRSGHPVITATINNEKNLIEINQLQEQPFKFDLEIELMYDSGDKEVIKAQISDKKEQIRVTSEKSIIDINVDPNVKLLFEQLR